MPGFNSIYDNYPQYEHVGYYNDEKVLCKPLDNDRFSIRFCENPDSDLWVAESEINDIVSAMFERDISEQINIKPDEIEYIKYDGIFVFIGDRSQPERTTEFLKSYPHKSDIYAVFDHEGRIVIYWKNYSKYVSMLREEDVELPDGDIWALTNRWSLEKV